MEEWDAIGFLRPYCSRYAMYWNSASTTSLIKGETHWRLSNCRDAITDTVMTTTSVPLASMMRNFLHFTVASLTCMNIRVSSSSWPVYTESSNTLWLLVAFSHCQNRQLVVATTMLPVWALHIFSDRNWKKSAVLFLSFRIIFSSCLGFGLHPYHPIHPYPDTHPTLGSRSRLQTRLLVDMKDYVHPLIRGTMVFQLREDSFSLERVEVWHWLELNPRWLWHLPRV